MQLPDKQLCPSIHGSGSGPSSSSPDPWCNLYESARTAAIRPDELYGPTPYDFNFCLPYLPQTLETDVMKLVPFVPRLHAELLFQNAVAYPEDFRFMAFSIPKTLEELLEFFEIYYRRNPSNMAFVAIDRKSATMAGLLTLIDTNTDHRTTTLAMGIAFRGFRGTPIVALSIALLLRYCLNTPSDAVPGLAIRRVHWPCSSDNIASQKLARRMGLRFESEQRWLRVVEHSKPGNGRPLRSDDPSDLQGMDLASFTMCFDDWEAGAKQLLGWLLGTTQYKAKL